ncbi:unnamed protein product, partial [Didymodactylos carnosus]
RQVISLMNDSTQSDENTDVEAVNNDEDMDLEDEAHQQSPRNSYDSNNITTATAPISILLNSDITDEDDTNDTKTSVKRKCVWDFFTEVETGDYNCNLCGDKTKLSCRL